jgi:hypothetical protein
LWKCSHYRLISPRVNPRTKQAAITEWWAAGEALLSTVKDRCRKLGVSIDIYARARLAVDKDWGNIMDHLLTARLTQNVYGFSGQAKYQPLHGKIRDNNVFLIGGDEQLCIPNLTSQHIAQVGSTPLTLLRF